MPSITCPYLFRYVMASFFVAIAASPYPLAQQNAEFSWYISPEELQQEFGPIVLRQKIDEDQYVGVEASANCTLCEQYGIEYQLNRIDDLRWKLRLEVVDTKKLQRMYDLHKLHINLLMKGNDGKIDSGTASIKMAVGSWAFADHQAVSEEKSKVSVSADQQAVRQIRELRELRNRSIVIYKIRGGLLDIICHGFAQEDSLRRQEIDSLCENAYPIVLHNCFDILSEMLFGSRFACYGNFGGIKRAFAEKSGVNYRQIDDAVLAHIMDCIQSYHAYISVRPESFYLVATKDKIPKNIAIAWGRQYAPDAYSAGILYDYRSTDFLSDFELPLKHQLLRSELDSAASDLVRLWPNGELRDTSAENNVLPADIEAARLIRGVAELSNYPVVIYEIQPTSISGRINRYYNELKKQDVEYVDSLCRLLCCQPVFDCYERAGRIISHLSSKDGLNYQEFKRIFAYEYDVQLDSLDDNVLLNIVGRIQWSRMRYLNRPEIGYLYLVVTDEPQSEPVAMIIIDKEKRDATFDIGAFESSDPMHITKVRSIFTGPAIREQLDSLCPGTADDIFRQLPGGSSEDSDWEELDLVKIWPIDEP